MAQVRRIVVNLPEDLVASIDNLVARRGGRSAFVREAVRLLLRQRTHAEASLERLRRGYESMGRLNLELADEGLEEDLCTFENYERALSERESG